MNHSINFDFWDNGYKQGWFDMGMIKQATISPSNPYGDITKEEYKEITGVDFDSPVEKG